jgi:hypothetical protein
MIYPSNLVIRGSQFTPSIALSGYNDQYCDQRKSYRKHKFHPVCQLKFTAQTDVSVDIESVIIRDTTTHVTFPSVHIEDHGFARSIMCDAEYIRYLIISD